MERCLVMRAGQSVRIGEREMAWRQGMEDARRGHGMAAGAIFRFSTTLNKMYEAGYRHEVAAMAERVRLAAQTELPL